MLTPEQRAEIAEYAAQGLAKAEIARRVSVSRASVHRVLKTGAGTPVPVRGTQGSRHAHVLLSELFELFEGLRDVKARCLDRASIAATLERIGWFNLPDQEHVPRLEAWSRLYLTIERHYNDVERQVEELRVDLPNLQRLYREMLDVQATWARYMALTTGDTEGLDDADGLALKSSRQEELAVLDKVVSTVKKLIIMSQ